MKLTQAVRYWGNAKGTRNTQNIMGDLKVSTSTHILFALKIILFFNLVHIYNSEIAQKILIFAYVVGNDLKFWILGVPIADTFFGLTGPS